jgi:hypothetical protein
MKTRTVVVVIISSTAMSVVSCSKLGGPSDSQIKQEASARFARCTENHHTVVDDVKISAKEVENNEATIFVGVEYHWTIKPIDTDAYVFPPCASFNKGIPKGMVQSKMIYRKYDSEWKLASNE